MPLLWGAEEMLTHGKAGQEIPVGEQTVGSEQGSNIIFPAASDMCHGRDRSLYDVTQIPYG